MKLDIDKFAFKFKTILKNRNALLSVAILSTLMASYQNCSQKNFTAYNNCSNSDASSTDENCLSSSEDSELRGKNSNNQNNSDSTSNINNNNQSTTNSNNSPLKLEEVLTQAEISSCIDPGTNRLDRGGKCINDLLEPKGYGYYKGAVVPLIIKTKQENAERQSRRRTYVSSSSSNNSTTTVEKESCVDYITRQSNYVAPIFKIKPSGFSATLDSKTYYSKDAEGGVSVGISDNLTPEQKTLFNQLRNLDGMSLKSFEDGIEKIIFKENKISANYKLKTSEKNKYKISYKWICNYVTVAEFEEVEVNTLNICGKIANKSKASKLDPSIYDLVVKSSVASSADEKIEITIYDNPGFICETRRKINSSRTIKEYTSIPKVRGSDLFRKFSATKQAGGWTFDSSYLQDAFIAAYNDPNAQTSSYPRQTAKEIIDNCDGELYAAAKTIGIYSNSKTNEICEISYGYTHNFILEKPE